MLKWKKDTIREIYLGHCSKKQGCQPHLKSLVSLLPYVQILDGARYIDPSFKCHIVYRSELVPSTQAHVIHIVYRSELVPYISVRTGLLTSQNCQLVPNFPTQSGDSVRAPGGSSLLVTGGRRLLVTRMKYLCVTGAASMVRSSMSHEVTRYSATSQPYVCVTSGASMELHILYVYAY